MKNKKILILASIVVVVCIILAVVFASSSGISSTNTAKLLELGNKYLLDQNYEEAILAFNKAIKIEPKNIDARMGLAEIYKLTGDFNNAEIQLKEILDIEPSSIDTVILLADLYIEQGKETEARTLLEGAIAKTSDRQVVEKLHKMLDGLLAEDDESKTDNEAEQEIITKSAAKMLELGNKYLLEENYEEAILSFNKAIEIEPKNIDARLGLAEVYIQLGDLDKVEIQLKEILDIEPSSIDTVIMLADLYVKQGKETEARTLLEDAIAKTSDQQVRDKLQTQLNAIMEKSSDKIENIEVQSDHNSSLLLQSVQTGDTITFGKYEQDNNTENGKEDIVWTVLAVENGKALLISEKNLDCQPYNNVNENATWETCSLRSWLNSTFIQTAFAADEQAQIIEAAIDNSDNSQYGTRGGNGTKDRVFLLSIAEASQYFANKAARIATNTPYTMAQGGFYIIETGAGPWWLRSPGYRENFAACVGVVGDIVEDGEIMYIVEDRVMDTGLVVRPALWLNLPS